MFLALIGLVLAVAVLAAVYLMRKIRGLSFLSGISKSWLAWLVSAGILLGSIALLSLAMSPLNVAVCLLHLTVIWLLCDGLGWLLGKWAKRPVTSDIRAISALVLSILYLGVGWINAHRVVATPYQFTSEKVSAPLRIVQFSDAHIGITFDGGSFAAQLEEINKQQPDIVVITGDFVDDSTSRQDMLSACQALEILEAPVYFVYGNHDKGYHSAEGRGWSARELASALESSGVVILEDEAVSLPGGYTLLGRQDASVRNRASMETLMALADSGSYTIVLDHQPGDYDAQAEAKADLVLSGHTHGGQMLPVTYVGQWMGLNDRTYGHERRDSTDFIVSSGISSWELKFKTGCFSEYVIIDIFPAP